MRHRTCGRSRILDRGSNMGGDGGVPSDTGKSSGRSGRKERRVGSEDGKVPDHRKGRTKERLEGCV